MLVPWRVHTANIYIYISVSLPCILLNQIRDHPYLLAQIVAKDPSAKKNSCISKGNKTAGSKHLGTPGLVRYESASLTMSILGGIP